EHVPQALPYGTSIEGLGLREVAEADESIQTLSRGYGAPARPRSVVMPSPMKSEAVRRSPRPATGGPAGAPPPPPAQSPPPAAGQAKQKKGSIIDRLRDAFMPMDD